MAVKNLLLPETHNMRQATRHYCLPSLLGDWDKLSEIVCGEEIFFCIGPTRAVAGQKYLVPARHDEPPKNQPRKGPFHMYSLSSHLPQFQQLAGATPLCVTFCCNV
jgi:hypothetical protein